MNAEILSIGDELLIGQVVNTNASWLGEQCSLLGIQVRRITTVGDDREELLAAFARAWEEQDVVIATGGLGPTHDDITREAICAFFDTELVLDTSVLRDIESLFADRKRAVTNVNRDQAMVPVGATVIHNEDGTAPGYHFEREGKHFFVTPGVPYEMHAMVEKYVLPRLRAAFRSPRGSLTLLTTGIPESTLSDALPGIDRLVEGTRIAFLPSPLGVRIRITAQGDDEHTVRDRLQQLRSFIEERSGEYLFGTGTQTLEEVVGTQLRDAGMTVAVAESCTGGLITDKLTNVPGSSQWFNHGIVAYSNESKIELLDVDPTIIRSHGAVSRETAEAMAKGIRRRAATDFGISTTGIAGPSGGSTEKPVGLVWIGISSDAGTLAHDFYFGPHRIRTKQRAAQAAMDMLRRRVCSLPPIPTVLTESS
ncbi:MAG: competence/damage-inducible protein A [Bacteroidetes bacterium]|nr:competence/damage-inducible protein A [Bacteroidota bacterium]